jgi:hypothetical protein
MRVNTQARTRRRRAEIRAQRWMAVSRSPKRIALCAGIYCTRFVCKRRVVCSSSDATGTTHGFVRDPHCCHRMTGRTHKFTHFFAEYGLGLSPQNIYMYGLGL